MAGLDLSRPFLALNIAVLTVSDSRTLGTDTSGGLLVDRLTAAGHVLAARVIVKDEVGPIRDQIAAWVADPAVDVVLSTGGTGFSPRDVTPEAVKPLFRREMDGFSVVFHQASQATVCVATLQSRAFAGQAEKPRFPWLKAMPARNRVDRHEADIVPVERMGSARIAQTGKDLHLARLAKHDSAGIFILPVRPNWIRRRFALRRSGSIGFRQPGLLRRRRQRRRLRSSTPTAPPSSQW